MHEIPVPVIELEKALGVPRAARAYGIDTRELRHNAFLDFMLKQPCGPALVRSIASRVADSPNVSDDKSREAWNVLTTGFACGFECECNRSNGKATRPDEIIRCSIEGRGEISLVVEMKVNARDSETQLVKYVDDEKKNRPASTVLGLLLSIRTIADAPGGAIPIVDGRVYRECIIEAAAISAAELPEKTRWLIHDYCETLEFLGLCDRVIVECGEWLRCNEHCHEVAKWKQEHGNWIELRIAREIAHRSRAFMQGWTPNAFPTKDGSIAQFSLNTDELDLSSSGDSASLLLQWKVGRGLELVAIAECTQGSIALMNLLFGKARDRLSTVWKSRKLAEFSGRLGKKSATVGRLPAVIWNITKILETLQQELPTLDKLAREVVNEAKAELCAMKGQPNI